MHVLTSHVTSGPSDDETAVSATLAKPKKTRNAFLQFRSYAITNKIVTSYANMSEASCRVAELWRDMSDEEKAPFFALAAEEKIKAALGLLPETAAPRRRRRRTARPKHRHEPSLRRLLTPPLDIYDDDSSLYSPASSESSLSGVAISPSTPAIPSSHSMLNTVPFHMNVSTLS